MRDYKKQMLDDYVLSLKDFYLNDEFIDDPNRTSPIYDGFICDGMDEESVAYLQDILDIAKIVECDDRLIFHTLLKSNDKPNFTRYLLEKTQLDILVNGLDADKNTIFMLLTNKVMSLDKKYPIYIIKSIIERGYKITDKDTEFVEELYNRNNVKQDTKKQIYWSHLRLWTILKDMEKYDAITYHGNLNAFFAIVSLKIDKVFGSKHDNLLAMSNNAISNYKRHIDIILHALNFYNRHQDIENSDKKGTFAKKKQERLDNPVEQDKDFEEIIFTVLPELKIDFQKTA